MKKIISIMALCAVLGGCNSDPQETPEQLSIQAVYGVEGKVVDNSKTASEVVSKLQTVRLVGCPTDFINAYKNYVSSWDMIVALEKKMYPQNMKKATSDIASFIPDFLKPDAVVALKKEWPAFAKEIDSATEALSKSYTNLMSTGARYNAVKKTSIF